MAIDQPGEIYTIYIVGDALTYRCASDQKVISALEKGVGHPVPVGCREGGCGVCRVQVLQGSYKTGKMSRAHVSQEDEKNGIVLSCRLFPSSDLLIQRAPIKERTNFTT